MSKIQVKKYEPFLKKDQILPPIPLLSVQSAKISAYNNTIKVYFLQF